MRKSKIYNIDLEELKFLVNTSNSMKEILFKLNMSVSGNSVAILRERISEENISFDHFYKKVANSYTLEEILVENSPYKSTNSLKWKLLKLGLLENKCYLCNLEPYWNGMDLTLVLDHKNGINNDNRLANLRLLCPNCHSQTPTFAGRNVKREENTCKNCSKVISNRSQYCRSCYKEINHSKPKNNEIKPKKHKKKKKHCTQCNVLISDGSKNNLCVSCLAFQTRRVDRPSKEILERLIQDHPLIYIAAQYGVSDNAVRKWCKYYGLPYRRKEIEEYFKQLTT